MADEELDRLAPIAARYRELLAAVDVAAGGDGGRRSVLFDSLRVALDRRAVAPIADTCLIAGSFVVENTIATTEQSLVWRARHRDIDLAVAIKVLPETRRLEASARARLKREAEIQLSCRNSHVLAAHALLRLYDGSPALVLDLARGGSVADILQGELPIEPVSALAILNALLGGLSSLHGAGVVHRDIAPQNLVFMKEGDLAPVIADFGIALRTGEKPSDIGLTVSGRPGYASPDQMEGAASQPSMDLHAAAIVACQLVERCPDKKIREGVMALTTTWPSSDAATAGAGLWRLTGKPA